MGKNPKYAKKDDSLVLGITNRLKKETVCLPFFDIDNSDFNHVNFYSQFKRLWRDFLTFHIKNGDKPSMLVLKSVKGYHALCFNIMNILDYHKLMVILLDDGYLDRWHVGYTIAKEFATLRLSKRQAKEPEFQFVEYFPSNWEISKPHFLIYCKRFRELQRHQATATYFDYGIDFVGYIMGNKDENL